MNLRKDKYTNVLFDADDPEQLAAHPEHVATYDEKKTVVKPREPTTPQEPQNRFNT